MMQVHATHTKLHLRQRTQGRIADHPLQSFGHKNRHPRGIAQRIPAQIIKGQRRSVAMVPGQRVGHFQNLWQVCFHSKTDCDPGHKNLMGLGHERKKAAQVAAGVFQ
jgi:hypothetical protein